MNDFKTNPRLVELRASIILNNIVNMDDKEESKDYLWIIKLVIDCAYPGCEDKFATLLKESMNNLLLGATKREIYTCLGTFYKEKKMWADKMRKNYGTFYNTASREYSKERITEKYVDSLIPRYANDNEYYNICYTIASFFDSYRFENNTRIENTHPRTYELKFWVIYNKIYNVLQNQEKMIKFLIKICEKFSVDYSAVAGLSTNISFISRSMPFSVPSKHQFYKEMINMGYMYGMQKGFISEHLLGRRRDLLYLNYYLEIGRNILHDDYKMEMTYCSTLDWKYIDDKEVIKFIDLFIKMMGYIF